MSKRRSWINYLGLLWMSRTFSCAPTRRRMATQNRHLFKSQSIVLSTGINFNNNFQRYLPSSSSCSATLWRSQQQVLRNSWKHLLKINPTLLRQFPTLSSLGSNTCVPKNGKPCEYLAIFFNFIPISSFLGATWPTCSSISPTTGTWTRPQSKSRI